MVLKTAKKKPVAWLVKLDGMDGAAVTAARTAAGARGFLRRSASEAREDSCGMRYAPSDLEIEASRCGPLDEWADTVKIGITPGICDAIAVDRWRRENALKRALRQLQKDGQGLVKDQEDAVLGALGILR